MSDFYQTGVVPTLHRLRWDTRETLESELQVLGQRHPIALVLPALYSEFEKPAMIEIVNHLREVRYLRRIVVALARATKDELQHARRFFEGFQTPVTFLWVDGERIQRFFRLLEEAGLAAGEDGKGRSCWLAYGYLLAEGDTEIVALHDCDIVNYDRELLCRLVYPVANPNLGFEFCKGFYARVTDRMHGRVTRLFVTPLVRAMKGMFRDAAFLSFLDSFRYPLAGEFAMRINLARVNRIPGDWGLEIGVLAEVYRNCSVQRICQVDLADTYEHKHQDLSSDNPKSGLRRMACDIAKTLFRTMAGEGLVLTAGHFQVLQLRYVRMAEDTISRYYADAMINRLEFDRHAEENAVAVFARSLKEAAQQFLEDPLGLPQIPNWNRVVAAIPHAYDAILEAVLRDNASAARSVRA